MHMLLVLGSTTAFATAIVLRCGCCGAKFVSRRGWWHDCAALLLLRRVVGFMFTTRLVFRSGRATAAAACGWVSQLHCVIVPHCGSWTMYVICNALCTDMVIIEIAKINKCIYLNDGKPQFGSRNLSASGQSPDVSMAFEKSQCMTQ